MPNPIGAPAIERHMIRTPGKNECQSNFRGVKKGKEEVLL
jgi:hypothetical protein